MTDWIVLLEAAQAMMSDMEARRDATHSGTYHILRCAGDLAIHCEICGRMSFSLWNVAHRYCGDCQVFHDDLRPTWMCE